MSSIAVKECVRPWVYAGLVNTKFQDNLKGHPLISQFFQGDVSGSKAALADRATKMQKLFIHIIQNPYYHFIHNQLMPLTCTSEKNDIFGVKVKLINTFCDVARCPTKIREQFHDVLRQAADKLDLAFGDKKVCDC